MQLFLNGDLNHPECVDSFGTLEHSNQSLNDGASSAENKMTSSNGSNIENDGSIKDVLADEPLSDERFHQNFETEEIAEIIPEEEVIPSEPSFHNFDLSSINEKLCSVDVEIGKLHEENEKLKAEQGI